MSDWLEQQLLPLLEKKEITTNLSSHLLTKTPFRVDIGEKVIDGQTDTGTKECFQYSYCQYFTQSCHVTAYSRDLEGPRKEDETEKWKSTPLLRTVLLNERITASGWEQDT